MSVTDSPIWDGNGGTLDPAKATQRDLLVALHVKMDNVVLPMLRDHESRLRDQENGRSTPAQAAVLTAAMSRAKTDGTYQRSLKVPIWSLGIAAASLVTTTILLLTQHVVG